MANPMDQVIAKGAGLAHGIRARMDGLLGVFKTLAEQHGEAGMMLKRAKADEAKRAELWPMIRASLKAHEQAELREVYPVLRQYEQLQDFVNRHDVEANQLSDTIARMDMVDPTSPQFGVLLDELIQLVENHVVEEERQIFPISQNVIGEARASEMEPRFIATADRIKKAELATLTH